MSQTSEERTPLLQEHSACHAVVLRKLGRELLLWNCESHHCCPCPSPLSHSMHVYSLPLGKQTGGRRFPSNSSSLADCFPYPLLSEPITSQLIKDKCSLKSLAPELKNVEKMVGLDGAKR